MQTALRRNRDRVLEEIEAACKAAGRDPQSVQLLAVSKSVSPEAALGLFRIGQTELGENRIDVLERKRLFFREQGAEATWHFIGHIQRNKAARVVREADVIHSVHSLQLLEAIDRHAREADRRPSIFLQLKLTEEPSKAGLSAEEFESALERTRDLSHVNLVGLMAMAPLREAVAEARASASETFQRLSDLALELPGEYFASKAPLLSMGMSGDFREAIGAGAGIVRIGSALFRGIDPADLSHSTPKDGERK